MKAHFRKQKDSPVKISLLSVIYSASTSHFLFSPTLPRTFADANEFEQNREKVEFSPDINFPRTLRFEKDSRANKRGFRFVSVNLGNEWSNWMPSSNFITLQAAPPNEIIGLGFVCESAFIKVLAYVEVIRVGY
ncbi:hypothetical protein TNCT_290511 [Trichonephila clavata]|uniref:Uncharacterized protein n=1 Tax=Trichonephila clavata TaxID=2740835 RepID=A0A8X6F915_TRICU|nr:hypothetical protein TNCT_290511 [Trichonephila clavata]